MVSSNIPARRRAVDNNVFGRRSRRSTPADTHATIWDTLSHRRSAMRRTRFSTLDVPPPRALSHWERSISRELFDANMRPFSSDAMVATCVVQRVGDVGAMSFDSDAMTLDRTHELVRDDPKASIYVSAVTSGTATYFDGDATHVAPAGSVLVYSPQRPYHIAFSNGFRQLFLDVPAELLALPDDCAAVFSSKQLRAPAAAELSAAIERDGSDAAVAAPTQRFVRALSNTLDDAGGRDYATLARRAVDRLYGDPDVGARDIAAEVAVSARHLSRVLANEGTSLGRLLTDRRVREALRLIESTNRTIGDIAVTSGFQGPTQLARAVRAATAETPTGRRRSVRRAGHHHGR
ncbi:helix-turn-helix transcriptional regulator [Pseudoclavibacter endophyticus]|nr:AraC family transcriptional regulator [Pseudoclavibacter endophyticus]